MRNLCSILTLRRQSWATLILWQAGIALMLWGFTAFLHRSQDASFFDRAGRQRLLAQQVREHLQMVKEGHKEDRARLLEHAELFGKGLSALEREHEVQEAWQPHGESEDILAEVRALWDPYRPQLERLARLPVGAKGFAAAYAEAIAVVPKLAAASDAFMKAEVAQDQAEARRFRGFIILLGVVSLIVALLGLISAHKCFLLPMAALQDAIKRFESGDFAARVERPSRGEMMSLIGAFNTMARSVERSMDENVRLARAVEQSADGIFMTDVEGRIQFVNSGFEKMTGFSRQEVVGNTPRILKSGEVDKDLYRALWETVKSGAPWASTWRNKRKDGALFDVAQTISPLKGPDGRIAGYVSVMRDITAALKLEADLRQSQKMDAIGRLAGGVAHDFNNILTSILGYCSLLKGQVASAAAHADLDEIQTSGERAAALTHQLLAFSRNQTLTPKVLDLNVVVAEMERMLKRVLSENVALTCRLSPELGRVKADKSQLEQIILNLAVNARDAMPGGGSLTIETAHRDLDEDDCGSLPDARPGRYARLTVTDTGTGMDARTRERIFEPFFTTKELGRGTGLGLSMVYGIVRQSGGYVAVRSEPGRGASFEVYLPIVVEEPEAEKKDAAPAPGGTGEVVLVVEDEAPLLRLTARLLKTAGYSVLQAADAESALALFSERGADIRLLLADVVLPKKNGRWLAEKLRGLKPGLKVLYMSGYADEVVSSGGVLHVGSHFLPKPFTAEVLLFAVRSALDS
ncbi:MAG: hypothetical protein A2506_01655 [Elusimicrobia bacterium RIFOXYD12_FULL_66_9]|nr:MAG: hypothetical protein A2506_01655 [Elusimicrobia bacterium RIFOXYD12_FULL_66_9]